MKAWLKLLGLIGRSVLAVFSLLLGLWLWRRVNSGRRETEQYSEELKDALAGLDEAQVRERFVTLAPEFRKTHAGAGRPRWVTNAELETFMSLGVVECVRRPHVAAGMLTIYKLTPLGENVDKRLATANGARRPFRLRLSRASKHA